MKKFDIDELRRDKNTKVCTRDGCPVEVTEIIDDQCRPIKAVVKRGNGYTTYFHDDGTYIWSECKDDLFMDDRSDIERELWAIVYEIEPNHEPNQSTIKECADRISAIARTEAEEYYEDKLDKCACDSFDKGYRAVQSENAQSVPMWRKSMSAMKDTSPYLSIGGKLLYDGKGHVIDVADLVENLPKKDESVPANGMRAMDKVNTIHDEIVKMLNHAKEKHREAMDNHDHTSSAAWGESVATLGKLLVFVTEIKTTDIRK